MPQSRSRLVLAAALFLAALIALLVRWQDAKQLQPADQTGQSAVAGRPQADGRSSGKDARGHAEPPERRALDLMQLAVRNERGAAVGGASVEIHNRTLRTDPEGRCSIAIDELARGQLVRVSHEHYTATIAELTPSDFQSKRKDIVLLLANVLAGMVLDHESAPVRDADVAVYDGRYPDLPDTAVLGRAKTGTDGAYRVDLPQAGLVYVIARKRGFVAANEVDAGTMSDVIRTTVQGSKKLDIRLFPVLVSAVGIVNRSPIPDDQVGNYCAFARDQGRSLADLAPNMNSVEAEARAILADFGKRYAHLSAWVGRPLLGKKQPSVLPVRVETVDGSLALVQAGVVRLADMTAADIASHDFAVGFPTGELELEVDYPTTVAMLKDGHATLWQRTVDPAAGGVRLTVPAGRYMVTPSPKTLLRTDARRTEVDVPAGAVARLPAGAAARADVAVLRIGVVGASGPVDLKSLHVEIRMATGRMSLRGLTGPDLRIYAEPGDCDVMVNDAAGLLRGRHRFVATAGMPDPVLISIAR